MTDYRIVTRHVRYWRGQIHKWSCSYSFTGSGASPDTALCTAFRNAESPLLYPDSTTNANGIWEVEVYLASGGVPVASETFFDPDVVASWIPPTGTGWGTPTAHIEPAAEVALLVTWLAGLSKTGKPVTFRHFYHAVPATTMGGGATPDISAATAASLQTAATALQTSLASGYGLVMGNARRLAGQPPTIDQFYSNHQMPRGRRKKVLVVNGVKYSGEAIKGGRVVVPYEAN